MRQVEVDGEGSPEACEADDEAEDGDCNGGGSRDGVTTPTRALFLDTPPGGRPPGHASGGSSNDASGSACAGGCKGRRAAGVAVCSLKPTGYSLSCAE
jgi:hypothetical protein